MNWFDRMSLWLMNNPFACVLIFVISVSLYIWLIYIEYKWGD